jgi:hypothetical protein
LGEVRVGDGTQSDSDFALAMDAARYGFSIAAIAILIKRARDYGEPGKWKYESYFLRTAQKARDSVAAQGWRSV